MEKQKNKVISKNSYLIALGIFIASIIIAGYIVKWYKIYQDENLNKAIISDYLTEVSYEEFNNYLLENSDFVVYIGISSQIESRSFENIFKNVVSNYDLYDNILFLNLTNYSNKYENYIERLNSIYGNEEQTIYQIPALLVFENFQIVEIEDKNLNKSTAINLLIENGIIDN